MVTTTPTSRARTAGRVLLGSALVVAGTCSSAREPLEAQVAPWAASSTPSSDHDIVLVSGAVELTPGSGLLLLPREQCRSGALAVTSSAAIFPDDTSQPTRHRDSCGLDTDRERAQRLGGQPLLIAPAVWCTRGRPA